MRIEITKHDGGYYSMRVAGNRGRTLAPRRGPGHGALVPHDVAHLLVEIELGLHGGVFGRVARMKSTWFPLSDSKEETRHLRRVKKWFPTPQDRADMAKSEQVVGIGEALLARKLEGNRELPDWFSRFPDGIEESPEVVRTVDRFEEFTRRWHSLPVDGSLTIDWPDAPKP